MTKKLTRLLVAFVVALTFVHTNIHAEQPPYSDTGYWASYCTGPKANSTECKAYVEYLGTQSEEAQNRLDEIDAERKQIAANLAAYDAKLKDLQKQTADKQVEIDDVQKKIDLKQKDIDAKQKEIKANEAEAKQLENKVKRRMVSSQGTMRFNEYLDLMMGATSFAEILRIANGLVSITEFDQKTLDDLIAIRAKLTEEKQALEKARQELEANKQTLTDQQNELLLLQQQTQVIIEEQQKQAAQLEAEGERITSNLDSIEKQMKELAEAGSLNAIVTARGWTFPVPGASISAHTWAYPSGGAHLGEDFAASVGTPILAVGNGVILNSADGCPTFGGLGSTCGANIGGTQGGGNQVYLLASINDTLYAIKYLHMKQGSPIAQGTIVTAGQQIGMVGSSGNSSGAHCHIEIFQLGEASQFSNYASSWNGDMTFGAGWAGSDRKCENTGSPCRIRPESVFGG